MSNIDELIAKFRQKMLVSKETEQFKEETAKPLADKVFNDDFTEKFKNLTDKINESIGSKIISFISEGKNRFVIEGQYHRVYFQKSKLEIENNLIVVNIIPILIWKGVTKHLGPISYYIDYFKNKTSWDIPLNSVEEYSQNLFSKLVDDEDFSM